ncbi:hypothetical protein K437DRAFT_212223, partial [Tilletiaria anomala UBC 951]
HWYGRDCMKALVLQALRDESLIPPPCNGSVIVESTLLPLLENRERMEYYEKQDEFDVKKRLYSFNKRRSKFLGSRQE